MSRSLILDVDTFKISKLSYNKSKMGLGSSIHIEILYEGAPFFIQFPSCKVVSIDSTHNKCDIVASFDIDTYFKYYQFLQIFDYQINEYLDKLEITNYNPGHTETSIIESGFKKTSIYLKIKTTANTKYFDNEKRKIHHYEINVGDTIIPLLTTKGIFSDSTETNQRWTAKQILKM